MPGGPELGENDASLDSLAEANLVSEERAAGDRGGEGAKDGGVDLMGVEVELAPERPLAMRPKVEPEAEVESFQAKRTAWKSVVPGVLMM